MTIDVSEILIICGLKGLFADAINIKCIPNYQPQCTPEWLLNSRAGLKTERNITGFISQAYTSTTFVLHEKVYDGSTWKYVISFEIPEEPQSIIQTENKWLIFSKAGRTLILDKNRPFSLYVLQGERNVSHSPLYWNNQIYVLKTRKYFNAPYHRITLYR